MNAPEIKCQIDALRNEVASIVHFRRMTIERLNHEHLRAMAPLELRVKRVMYTLENHEALLEQATTSIKRLSGEIAKYNAAIRLEAILDQMKSLGVEPAKAKHLRKQIQGARRKLVECAALRAAWQRDKKNRESLDVSDLEAEVETVRLLLDKERKYYTWQLWCRSEGGLARLEAIEPELQNLLKIIPNTEEPVANNQTYKKLKKLENLMAQYLALKKG